MFGFNVLDTSYYNTFGLACLSAQSRAMTSNMLTMPTMGLNPFMCGNNYLLDPNFTMWQMQQSFNPGGNCFFGGWNNSFGNNAWWNTMGWNGTPFNSIGPAGGGSNSSSSSSKKPYDKICTLLNELDKEGKIDEELENINNIKKDKELDSDQKFEKLLAIYNKLSDNTKISTIKKKNNDAFVKAGLENNKDVLNEIANFEKHIPEITKDTPNSNAEFVIKQSKNILSFISAWNDDKQKHIFDYIDAKVSNSDSKTKLKESISGKLINKVDDIKDKLDDEVLLGRLEKASKALNNDKDDITKFNELYVLARCAATVVLNDELERKYGSKVGISSMLDKELSKDLKDNEKLGTIYNSCSKYLKDSGNNDGSREESPELRTAEAEEELKALEADRKITKVRNPKRKDGIQVYKETTMTGCSKPGGTPDYYRLYLVKDGEIVEWENCKVGSNNKFVWACNIEPTHTPIDSYEIEDRIDNVKKSQDMKEKGKTVAEILNDECWTSDSQEDQIKEALESLDSNNILSFLEGYNNGKDNNLRSGSGRLHEGLIEHLADDTDDICNDKTLMLKVPNLLLKKAEELGFIDNKYYKKLQQLVTKFDNKYNETNSISEDAFADDYTVYLEYDEAFDDCIYCLYNAIKGNNNLDNALGSDAWDNTL